MRRYIPAVLILTILAACSSPGSTYTVEMIDGVRHVHNLATLWGEHSRIDLEFVQTVGEPETDDDRYLLYFPIDAAAGETGDIYILDSRRPAVRRYDRNGEHVSDIGAAGSGPGEFRSSLCLDVDSAYNLYLSDMDNGRLSVFEPDGGFSRVVPLGNFFHFFCVLSDGRIAGLDLSYDEDPPKLARLLDREGNPTMTFCESTREGERMMTFLVNQCNIENDSRDNIYVSFDHFNRIEKFSPGGSLLTRIDRPLNFEVGHRMRMSTYEREGELVEFPDPVLTYVSSWIAVDGKDRLWVMTYSAQPEETGSASVEVSDHTILQFDIFDSEGVLLCRLPAPLPMSRFRIYGDTLLLLDSYQGVCLNVFRITG